MEKTNKNTYSGAIRTTKQEDFEIFLRQIGLSACDISFEIRGEYSLYTIDLSEKENYEIHNIREELNNTIADFL